MPSAYRWLGRQLTEAAPGVARRLSNITLGGRRILPAAGKYAGYGMLGAGHGLNQFAAASPMLRYPATGAAFGGLGGALNEDLGVGEGMALGALAGAGIAGGRRFYGLMAGRQAVGHATAARWAAQRMARDVRSSARAAGRFIGNTYAKAYGAFQGRFGRPIGTYV